MIARPRAAAIAVGVATAVGLLGGCGGEPAVTPQPCDQELRTASFVVCLPARADGLVLADAHGSATVDGYRIDLLEVAAQPGDPDQAAFAALDQLLDSMAEELGVPPGPAGRPASATLGREGFLDVDGADGAFESVRTVFDTGEVDDVVAWGRGITVAGRAGAVAVIRDFDGADVSADQAATADAEAMPMVVTLAPAVVHNPDIHPSLGPTGP